MPAKKPDDPRFTEIRNSRALHEYFVDQKFEAGIRLLGTEVKSVRNGKAQISEAFGRPEKGELWLVNAHIAQYLAGGPWNHEPLGARKLLLHRNEIHKLSVRTEGKGLTVIPLRIYFRNGIAKCEIALAQGKKNWDRRADEKKKEARREVDESMYRNRRR